MQLNSSIPASVFRRVAAFLYDCLLLIAIFFVVTSIALTVTNGEAIQHYSYKLLLLVVAWIFFAWFWINGGQTLGMRAWRIKLVNNTHEKIDLQATLTRFVTGLFTFGFTLLFALLRKDKRCLHDLLSRTHVVYLKKTK